MWVGVNIAGVSLKDLNSDKGTDKDLSSGEMSTKWLPGQYVRLASSVPWKLAVRLNCARGMRFGSLKYMLLCLRYFSFISTFYFCVILFTR